MPYAVTFLQVLTIELPITHTVWWLRRAPPQGLQAYAAI